MRSLVIFSLVFATGCDILEKLNCPGGKVESLYAPFAFDQEWDYLAEAYGVVIQPAIGQLTDDNGDGLIDVADTPDIVFTTYFGDTLVALHGDGSGVLFEKDGYWGRTGGAIGDVDGDGEPDIVAGTTEYDLAVLDARGDVRWTAPQPFFLETEVLITDLDADGTPEVISDGTAYNGKTGETLFAIPPHGWRSPVAADLDGDGTQELIVGTQVYSHTGALEWSTGITSAYLGVFAEAVNIDDDGGLETLFVVGDREVSTVHVHDDDGAFIRSFEVPVGNAGKPGVADFDEDGDVEIAVSGVGFVSVHELDGTELWRAPTVDERGLKGVTAADLDHDDVSELLLADEGSLRIFNGATGDVLFQDLEHRSAANSFARPQVADLDNDGLPDVVVASDSWPTEGVTGVSIYGTPGNGWVDACPDN